jgi:hypothetical protein
VIWLSDPHLEDQGGGSLGKIGEAIAKKEKYAGQKGRPPVSTPIKSP